MEGYATEEQQVEAIKKWWKKNGSNAITAGLLVLAVIFGGQAWMGYRNADRESASAEYEAMMQSLQAGENDAAFSRGDTLLQKYSSTPYATLAAFALSKLKIDANEPVAAEAHLRWILQNDSDDNIQMVAKLRLARVLLAQQKYDDALAVVPAGDSGSFKSSFDEVKGDIYLAKGDKKSAQEAYRQALQSLPVNSNSRQLLQMKLDDFGTSETSVGENNS